MSRRGAALASGVVAVGLLAPRRAVALDARVEAAAVAAMTQAAGEVRANDVASAMLRLARAKKACGTDRCSPETKAALLRDLGAVLARATDTDDAVRSFREALALEPDGQLDPRYDAPEARAAWQAATAETGGAKPRSDLNHTPPAQKKEIPPPLVEPSGQGESKEAAASTDEDDAETEAPPPPRRRVAERPTAYATWWLGVAGSAELEALPSSQDVCVLTSSTVPANSTGYYCTNPNGSDFPSRLSGAQNASLIPGQSGAVTGGVHPGDVRGMLAVDYVVSPSFLTGVRLGIVGNTYPGSAAIGDGHAFSSRLHLEARGTYLFGDAPLASLGFAPMAFLAAGVAEFDGHATTFVSMQNIAGQQPVVAWKTSGPWFLALGGGLRYQFSRRAAFMAAVRANAAFGGVGVLLTYGPEITFQYGF
jgi:hypothetical protein